jgi:hypothetical protein
VPATAEEVELIVEAIEVKAIAEVDRRTAGKVQLIDAQIAGQDLFGAQVDGLVQKDQRVATEQLDFGRDARKEKQVVLAAFVDVIELGSILAMLRVGLLMRNAVGRMTGRSSPAGGGAGQATGGV